MLVHCGSQHPPRDSYPPRHAGGRRLRATCEAAEARSPIFVPALQFRCTRSNSVRHPQPPLSAIAPSRSRSEYFGRARHSLVSHWLAARLAADDWVGRHETTYLVHQPCTRLWLPAANRGGGMSRLPIRWKLTLAFALALAIVLSGVGVFLRFQLSADVDNDIERGLRARADQLSGLLMREPIAALPSPAKTLEPDETIAQILTRTGRVVAASSYADVRLLTPEQMRLAATKELFVDRPGDAMVDESHRVFASPVEARGEAFIVVVTDSLDERAETLASTLGVEVVGLIAALIASCGVGHWVSGLALRPVEALRQRAAAISGDDLADGERAPLPVSPVSDEIGRLGLTLNDMLDRISRAQAAQRDVLDQQRRFLADASHQLRTPLAIIKAEVELAQPGTTKDDDLRATTASIGEETDRLSRLTEQLLVLAAAEEHRLSLTQEPVRIVDLLEEVADRGRGRAQLQGRMIVVDSDGAMISADRQRLEYALGNL